MLRRTGRIAWTLAALSALSGQACTGPKGKFDPVLSAVDPLVIAVGQRGEISVDATDRDDDELRFSFQLTLFPDDPERTLAYSDAAALERGITWDTGGHEARFQWAPSPNHVGDHRLTIRVDDDRDGHDDATVAITVRPGLEQGSPVFDSHLNLVLDLARNDCLPGPKVSVDDADSISVHLRLESAPEGMELRPTIDTGKEAELLWCPTEEQLEDQSLFTFFVVADDGETKPVRVRMTVVIRRADPEGGDDTKGDDPRAEGTGPRIEFSPLPSQSGDHDFVIEATFLGDDSRIVEVYVKYTVNPDPSDEAGYRTVRLVPVGRNRFVGSIPSVAKLAEEAANDGIDGSDVDLTAPVRFFYYLCVRYEDEDEDEDEDEEGGDHTICVPDQALFSFVWTPAEEVCPHDPGEPNDVPGDATPLPPGESGPFGLCGPQEAQDCYSFAAEAGDTIVVDLSFMHDIGDLDLELWPPHGEHIVADSLGSEDNERIEYLADVSGQWSAAVIGYDGAGNIYSLVLAVEPGRAEPQGSGGSCDIFVGAGPLNDSRRVA